MRCTFCIVCFFRNREGIHVSELQMRQICDLVVDLACECYEALDAIDTTVRLRAKQIRTLVELAQPIVWHHCIVVCWSPPVFFLFICRIYVKL